MEFKCPSCHALIYSRRNLLCGVCGKRLPPELLFSAAERGALDKEMEEARRRARPSWAGGDAGSIDFGGGDCDGGGDGGGGD